MTEGFADRLAQAICIDLNNRGDPYWEIQCWSDLRNFYGGPGWELFCVYCEVIDSAWPHFEQFQPFCRSLDESPNFSPVSQPNPVVAVAAMIYDRDFLVREIFWYFERHVVPNRFPDDTITIRWGHLPDGEAGRTIVQTENDPHTPARRVEIVLDSWLCDTAERLRDVLIHELCHAAVILIDGSYEPDHGLHWKEWTWKAVTALADLPCVKIYHRYDYRFDCRGIDCNLMMLYKTRPDFFPVLCPPCLRRLE